MKRKTHVPGWRQRISALGPLAWLNLIVLVLAVIVFCVIAHEVADGDHIPIERQFMQSLRTSAIAGSVGKPWIVEIARDITALGSVVVLTTLTAFVVGFLALSRRFEAAAFLAIAALGGQCLNAALKTYYGRERPDPSLRWIEIDSLSFPSGHATSSAVIYLTLAVLLVRLAENRAEKIYLIAAALFISFLVGFSRVYLGVHYPTDVIAGWAVGIAWAQLCWFATQAIGRRRLATATPE